jgi:hypothetical protein
MTGRPCHCCSLPYAVRTELDRRLMAGESPRHAHRWLVDAHKVSWAERATYDHRKRHVQLLSRAARRISEGAQQSRDQVAVAKAVVVGNFDAIGYLQPAAIAKDIKTTSDRLETAAADAAHAKLYTPLASRLLKDSRMSPVRFGFGLVPIPVLPVNETVFQQPVRAFSEPRAAERARRVGPRFSG